MFEIIINIIDYLTNQYSYYNFNMVEAQEIETSGYGEFDYMNGDVYVGQWETIDKVRKRHGHGKFIHGSVEEEYEGE